jgi:hypothetical protein
VSRIYSVNHIQGVVPDLGGTLSTAQNLTNDIWVIRNIAVIANSPLDEFHIQVGWSYNDPSGLVNVVYAIDELDDDPIFAPSWYLEGRWVQQPLSAAQIWVVNNTLSTTVQVDVSGYALRP